MCVCLCVCHVSELVRAVPVGPGSSSKTENVSDKKCLSFCVHGAILHVDAVATTTPLLLLPRGVDLGVDAIRAPRDDAAARCAPGQLFSLIVSVSAVAPAAVAPAALALLPH